MEKKHKIAADKGWIEQHDQLISYGYLGTTKGCFWHMRFMQFNNFPYTMRENPHPQSLPNALEREAKGRVGSKNAPKRHSA